MSRGEDVDYSGMSSMFQSEAVQPGEPAGAVGEGVAAGERVQEPWGTPRPRRQSRFPYDLVTATRVPLAVYATDNSKMAIEEASLKLRMLLEHAGLGAETEERKHGFFNSMLIANAINSSSVLSPDRAVMRVHGCRVAFSYYSDVVLPLGSDVRRFFRAYAEDQVRLLRELHDRRATFTEEEYEMWNSIERVAMERGLERAPWLVGDAADACGSDVLTISERRMLKSAKAIVLGNTVNRADETDVAARIEAQARPTQDRFDGP
jgi:hypothetical protein